MSHEALIREFLDALVDMPRGDAMARFFTPDVEQVELPNLYNPRGGTSNLAQILERADQVAEMLESHRYIVHSILVVGDRAAVEATWHGTLRAGNRITAHLAMCFEFKGGLIHRQRNYDCFEPW